MTDPSGYPFDKVPRGRLPINVNRRKFLPSLLAELEAYNKKMDGGVVLKLEDLGNCPDEDLAFIMPKIVPTCKLSTKGNSVYASLPTTSQPIELFPLDAPARIIFNFFDGTATIDEISEYLSHETGWTIERAFAYTRGFFLWLVLAGVCIPKGA